MTDPITDAQWQRYEDDGYVSLGRILDEGDLSALQERIDAVMLGRAELDYDLLMMQLDSLTGQYGDAGPQTRGHKGPTLAYRKIEGLEFDPLFLEYMQRPVFRRACARQYGAQTPIAIFRAMFMNKPARQGTVLPWHQDRWTFLGRDPLLTIYTALDPATRLNGCVQVIRGSHRWGLVNPEHTSGFLTPEQAQAAVAQHEVVFLELEPGEVALLHNWLLHSSDVNRSGQARRAFSVCVMDAATRRRDTGQIASRSVLFGEGALTLEGVAALHAGASL
ncbi:MAG: phytanoyl-CoA dioxygenase family protein [Candidatus Latescibacterota bacterium]